MLWFFGFNSQFKGNKSKNKQEGQYQAKKHNKKKKKKGQPAEWEKMFSDHISDDGLISKIHKELI